MPEAYLCNGTIGKLWYWFFSLLWSGSCEGGGWAFWRPQPLTGVAVIPLIPGAGFGSGIRNMICGVVKELTFKRNMDLDVKKERTIY